MPKRGRGEEGSRRRRSERDEEEEEDEMTPAKRRASVYFEDMADESGGEEEEDEEEEEDGFVVHSEDDILDEYELVERSRVPRTPLVDRRDEEEMDVEAMEKMVNERYGSRSSMGYDEDFEDFTELEQQTLLPSVRDPKLWLVKCLPGREREVAAFLMQKSLDKDSKSQIEKTVAVLGKDLAKYFEPGSQVKVICGQLEGATGMVVKVDQNKLVILSDASKDLITVFSAQVVESKETSKSKTKFGIGYSNQDRPHNSSASRPLPEPANSSSKMLPGSRSSSTLGRGTENTWKRHDSFFGTNVKILHGPYKGYRGCVKGVNGQNVRVELQAQMKVVTVERIHISDKLAVSNTSYNVPLHKTGGETPLHPRTPMQSIGGETPWRTPFRSPHPATPIHHGSTESTYEQWNPFSLTSPSRLIPTP